jgi:hypothetical protein
LSSTYLHNDDEEFRKCAEALKNVVPEDKIDDIIDTMIACGWLLPYESVVDLQNRIKELEEKEERRRKAIFPDEDKIEYANGFTWTTTSGTSTGLLE